MAETLRVAMHGALEGIAAVLFVAAFAVVSAACVVIPLAIVANLGWVVGLPVASGLVLLVAAVVGAILKLRAA